MSNIGSANTLALVAESLMAHECARVDANERAAATRTMGKIFAELVPLMGSAGVLALYARSAVHASARCKALDGLVFASDSIDAAAEELERHFAAIPAADVVEAGTTLASSFLAVVSTFIGDHLTLQVLQNAWPMIGLVKEPK